MYLNRYYITPQIDEDLQSKINCKYIVTTIWEEENSTNDNKMKLIYTLGIRRIERFTVNYT